MRYSSFVGFVVIPSPIMDAQNCIMTQDVGNAQLCLTVFKKIFKACIYHHHHQFLLSLRGHRASTKHRHLVLFPAILLTSFQLFPFSNASLWTDLCHACLGLPRLLFPCGFQSKASLSMASFPFLIVCPTHFHFHLLFCVDIFFSSFLLQSSSFEITSSQQMFRILCKQWLMKVCSFEEVIFISFHVTDPYNNTNLILCIYQGGRQPSTSTFQLSLKSFSQIKTITCYYNFTFLCCSGIHLKDLISLHVALPDTIEGEMINVRKMAQLSLIIQELEELQNSPTPIDVNMDLVNTLRVCLLYKLVKMSIIPKTIQSKATMYVYYKRKNIYFYNRSTQLCLTVLFLELVGFTLSQATKALRESRGIAVLYF